MSNRNRIRERRRWLKARDDADYQGDRAAFLAACPTPAHLAVERFVHQAAIDRRAKDMGDPGLWKRLIGKRAARGAPQPLRTLPVPLIRAGRAGLMRSLGIRAGLLALAAR